MNTQKTNQEFEPKVKCAGGCGTTLTAPETFREFSFCASYCCQCCPDSKKSPCQRERERGSFFDNL